MALLMIVWLTVLAVPVTTANSKKVDGRKRDENWSKNESG